MQLKEEQVTSKTLYLCSQCTVGVCETIFNQFIGFVAKAIDFSTCCPHCDGASFGCATCLFRHCCDVSNDSLLTCMGLKVMNLYELELSSTNNASTFMSATKSESSPALSSPLRRFNITNRSTQPPSFNLKLELEEAEKEKAQLERELEECKKEQELWRSEQELSRSNSNISEPQASETDG